MSINPVGGDLTGALNSLASEAQTSASNAMNAVSSDIASGNTTQAGQDMNQFALAQLQQQEVSAMEGEIQDTIKAEIQNLSKA